MNDQTIAQDNPVQQIPMQKTAKKRVDGISIDNLPDLLTVGEVAELLRVSKLTIKRWGKRGKLPAIRINARGDRRYRKEAVLWLLGIQPNET
ncbi:MerR family transcriptional regulator [Candidatus Parcubacteria bacterium]|nr:MerR family transcriptional regulator [Candidatus Parcubacteria bacterium]